MPAADPDNSTMVIPARSRRQVMDWSLVLASQDIPATIIRSDETGWGLEVAPEDYERSQDAICQYRRENQGWHWRQRVPWAGATFHWGAFGWCLLLVLVHWAGMERFGAFREAGSFETAAVHRGEWWRTFTAVLLHFDLGHLLTNVSFGLLLFGLAMARFGAGPALLASYLAGAAGNVAGLLLYPHLYTGMGASGMVMGALGLIAIPPPHAWSAHPRAFRQLLQAAGAGILMFVLIGVDPKSDVIAHLGGFVAGLAFGWILSRMPAAWLERGRLNVAAWIILVVLLSVTVWLAASTALNLPPSFSPGR